MSRFTKYVATKAGLEVLALWEVSKRTKPSVAFHELRNALRYKREEVLCLLKEDKLASKQARYGNHGRWSVLTLREMSHALYRDKAPGSADLGKWVSVEIECILPDRNAETAFALWCRKQGHSKVITIKDDGSIHPDQEANCDNCDLDEDGEHIEDCRASETRQIGKEIVVTFKQGDWALIGAVCNELNKLGASVNKTCGLHVHFDCRHLSPRQAGTLGRRLALAVPVLKQMLPASRRQNQFCRDTINKMRTGSRYAFVNMQAYRKHCTIEVRGHSSTTDATKIINWIEILSCIMTARNTKQVENMPSLLSTFRFRPELASYITERIMKFSGHLYSTAPQPAQPDDDVASDNVVILPTVAPSANFDNIYSLALAAMRTG